ncbi:hypothetical protein J3459_008141 [Metarhizium acridum]|nr:hypothetical protein J3459_008141 [Metarhizium acridum]
MKWIQLIAIAAVAAAEVPSDCPAYDNYAAQRHPPYSCGKWKYPYQRPEARCRSYVVPEVEMTLKKAKAMIKDGDLYRLFLNTWPNTVDTTILWHGKALDNADEELAFVTTGDIHAMWLRDSANQLQSYKPILNITSHNATNNIASLFRGTINLQSRYIRKFPYCNAFQPPPDSKLPLANHKRSLLAKRGDTVNPPYDPSVVWECKYELDSISAFLQLSWDYYDVTEDTEFFGKYGWADAVKTILKLANDMMTGTYTEDGQVNKSPYTWFRDSNSATETVSNRGTGNPVAACAEIMQTINKDTASQMLTMARGIESAIEKYGIVKHPKFGDIYAYEVDGFGSHNFMDDANIPSLLSTPHIGFKPNTDTVYRRTREFVLSRSNPYFGFGPVLNSTGGPHLGPGMAWPMGVIMQTMTSSDDGRDCAWH